MELRFKEFLSAEDGQTTTEYILILAVVVTIIMQFKKSLKGIVEKLIGNVNQAAESATSDGDYQ